MKIYISFLWYEKGLDRTERRYTKKWVIGIKWIGSLDRHLEIMKEEKYHKKKGLCREIWKGWGNKRNWKRERDKKIIEIKSIPRLYFRMKKKKNTPSKKGTR